MELKKIRAFTLFEIVMVAAIIWILTLWMTTYMWNSWERAKIIEAQWCASAMWWELKNYVYNALTSKILKTGDQYIYPDYYYIDFIDEDFLWCNTMFGSCKKLGLWYSTGDLKVSASSADQSIQFYKEISPEKICNNWKLNIKFQRTWDLVKYMIMNKWFTPKKINDTKTFYMQVGVYTNLDEYKAITWNIIILLCNNKDCETVKQIWRYYIDARSQTIEFQKCKFYNEDDPTICKTREDEQDDET